MIRPISRTWLVLDIVGACLGLAITLFLSSVGMGAGMSPWLDSSSLGTVAVVLVSVVLWGAAAITRLAPSLALIIAWAAALLQMTAGLAPNLYDVAIFFVLFGTAAWGTRRVMWLGGASTVAGGLFAGLYISFVSFDGNAVSAPAQPDLRTVLLVMFMVSSIVLSLAIAWGAGLLWRQVLRGRVTRLAQLQAEAAAIEEQERVRIARDMHDVVAHSLAVVISQSDGARYVAATNPELAQEALATIAQTARSALSDVRMLLTQLRHRQGDGPQPTLADLESLFAHVRQTGIEPRVTVDPMPPGEPPAAIQMAVYRILQEALTNAIRHGDGDVEVHLAWHPDRVELDVRNTTSHARIGADGGHGLVGMRERAQLVGGTLSAQHEAGRFVVRATLPIGPPLN